MRKEEERKKEKKDLNKQIQPVNGNRLVNRLMAAELSASLIDERLSRSQAGPSQIKPGGTARLPVGAI